MFSRKLLQTTRPEKSSGPSRLEPKILPKNKFTPQIRRKYSKFVTEPPNNVKCPQVSDSPLKWIKTYYPGQADSILKFSRAWPTRALNHYRPGQLGEDSAGPGELKKLAAITRFQIIAAGTTTIKTTVKGV